MTEPTLEAIQSKSLGEEAAEKIRQAISSGRLKAGTRLVEAELARELGLSRSPVREALYLLEQEGLIVRHLRRGAFVRGLSRRETEEIFSLRTVLEGFAVERAMKKLTDENRTHLRQIVDSMREMAEKNDADGFSRLDAAFHEYLCSLAHHQVLQQVFSTLRARTLQYMTETTHLGTLTSIAHDHEELLEQILSGDSVRAVTAIQDHIRASAERLLRHYPVEIEGSSLDEVK